MRRVIAFIQPYIFPLICILVGIMFFWMFIGVAFGAAADGLFFISLIGFIEVFLSIGFLFLVILVFFLPKR